MGDQLAADPQQHGTPNGRTGVGVISRPPPTPVRPTTVPTTKSDKVCIHSMARCSRFEEGAS
jgi:hypothetical protein